MEDLFTNTMIQMKKVLKPYNVTAKEKKRSLNWEWKNWKMQAFKAKRK